MTAHTSIADMPNLIDCSSSDKDDYFTHQYESEFDSVDGDVNDNRKMPAQLARNENENLVKIGNDSGNLNSDDDVCSLLIQGAIEHNLTQSLQEDDC
eukprot:9110203-Ditylum_brightwellii.AAC.1